jgi:two-component system sensor histidine kinase UhpB
MAPFSSLPIYWRVCLINAAVFLLGTVILLASPATVSDVSVGELGVLALGLGVIMVANALLLRSSLVPVDRLVAQMQRVELERLGQRLPETRDGSVHQLVASFNTMTSRLELERARTNARALAAQEAERHRIARELHDEIGQGLTVVLLGLERAARTAPPDLEPELRMLQETARASLHEVREVARRLRPGVLEDLGLVNALAALASDFSRHTGGAVRRSFVTDLPPLSAEQELVLYRVAQEALTNAARHAGARNVRLALTTDADSVELVVADDGRGLARAPEGTGLRGMRERTLLVGGRLSVRSPGAEGGTEVRLRVPLRTEVPA